MSFAQPYALYLLLLLIPFTILVIRNFHFKRKILHRFLDQDAQGKMVKRSGRESDFFRSFFLILAFIFLIFALARPRWGEKLEQLNVKGLKIQFLLDTSISMAAEDLKPNRFETAKTLISQCIDTLKTDMVALIDFAGAAYVQCPFTSDYEAFKLLVSAATFSPEKEQGTDFGQAFSLAVKGLSGKNESHKLIIMITDGEDQEEKWQEPMNELKKENVTIFTVGVGAPTGAPIPIQGGREKSIEYKKDREGAIINTRLNEEVLIQIARETKGHYFRLTDAEKIDEFLTVIRNFERKVISQKIKTVKIERFAFPLLAAIIFLFLEMIITDKKVKWVKKSSF